MKLIRYYLFLFPLLSIGCGSVKQTNTTVYLEPIYDSISGDFLLDTVALISSSSNTISRQERLVLKDSMKHVERLGKIERDKLKDSLSYLHKQIKVERKIAGDSLSFELKKQKLEIKELKKINQQKSDSLNYLLKQSKIDNKHEEKTIKQEDKQEKNLLKQQGKNDRKEKSKWLIWLLVGMLVFSLGLNLFLLFIKK